MSKLKQGPASTGECPFCHGTVRSDEKTCPNCGADNPHYVKDTPRRIFHPKTIEELKEYCAERGMPLLRMRFFIGEDYKEPRAFGIYRDGDRFVVYKNKDNGSRAVRYDGPDEAHAVNEIFQKLLSECHNRGIYPDREPGAAPARSVTASDSSDGRMFKGIWAFFFWPLEILLNQVSEWDKTKKASLVIRSIFGGLLALLAIFLQITLLIVLLVVGIKHTGRHWNDGYYRLADQSVYYRCGNDVYYLNQADDWWIATSMPYGQKRRETFLGRRYSDAYGFNVFDKTRAGYPDYGYYRLQDGAYYYTYYYAWFIFDGEEEAWKEYCELPRCPTGFKQADAYRGADYDPAWGVPDVDDDFYIATLKDWHSRDGYYRFGDTIYYYYGYAYDRSRNWFVHGESGWQSAEAPAGGYRAYDAAFLSAENDPAWGLPEAKDAFAVVIAGDSHGKDGYYRFGDATYYYYGSHLDPSDNWYTYDSDSSDWVRTDAPTGSYDESYTGEDWNSDWGTESFTDSDTWDSLNPSSGGSDSGGGYESGGSYDSWDSGGTDWSSDW